MDERVWFVRHSTPCSILTALDMNGGGYSDCWHLSRRRGQTVILTRPKHSRWLPLDGTCDEQWWDADNNGLYHAPHKRRRIAVGLQDTPISPPSPWFDRRLRAWPARTHATAPFQRARCTHIHAARRLPTAPRTTTAYLENSPTARPASPAYLPLPY